MTPDLVFVYGTLKRGCGNHYTMQRAGGEFVGPGVTVERFPLVVDGLPYLLNRAGSGQNVHGEIYRIPTIEGWRLLDRLEGHPRFYCRRVISCEVAGAPKDVWTYFIEGSLRRFAHLKSMRDFN